MSVLSHLREHDCLETAVRVGRGSLQDGMGRLLGVHTQCHPWSHGPCTHVAAVTLPFSGPIKQVASGYAQGTNAEKIARLEDDVKEPAKRLAKDIELFDEGGSSAP